MRIPSHSAGTSFGAVFSASGCARCRPARATDRSPLKGKAWGSCRSARAAPGFAPAVWLFPTASERTTWGNRKVPFVGPRSLSPRSPLQAAIASRWDPPAVRAGRCHQEAQSPSAGSRGTVCARPLAASSPRLSRPAHGLCDSGLMRPICLQAEPHQPLAPPPAPGVFSAGGRETPEGDGARASSPRPSRWGCKDILGMETGREPGPGGPAPCPSAPRSRRAVRR